MNILQLAYLFLPAAIANMAPVFARRANILRFLDKPMDGGMRWRGKQLLGPHKTWRGLVSGIITAVAVTGIQALLDIKSLNVVEYNAVWLPLGVALGAGALLGDALKSLFKRRVGVPSGSAWSPYDQIDFTIGASLALLLFLPLTWPDAFAAVSLFAACHVIINWIGYALRWRKSAW